MPEISVGAAVSSGFALIRTRPMTVWAWGLVNVALLVAALAIFGSALLPLLAAGVDPKALEQDPSRMMATMFQIYGGQLVISIGRIFIQAIVLAAVFRAVLQPDQSRFAYMRLGMAELYLLLLTIAEAMVLGFGMVIAILPIVFLAVALGVAKAVAAAIIVGIVGGIVLIGAVLYFALRFALAGPMIIADNEFRFFESWRMTKGHVWPMFQTALIMFLIFVGLELALFIVFGALGLGVLIAVAGGAQNIEGFFRQSPTAILGVLGPLGLVMAVIGSFVIGAFYAIAGAPWAEIYRQLTPPDSAKAFS